MNKVYQIITDRIIEMLDKGTVPWRKPWAGGAGFPENMVSGKEYRGVNVLILGSLGYGSNQFLTFKQAKAAVSTLN